ncbi:MAG TPA: zinc metallopeptidase [Clostridiaceae bacterium]|jgi:Zn-dependent membrane protease YugP|nr:zinc metallopeptidase [Clostridiaceae bacterium]
MPYFFIDYWYVVLVLPVLVASMIIQVKLQSTYNRYSQVRSRSGYTGAQIAEKVLRENGIYDVRVEHVRGNLTDHYSPKENVIRLSDGVYNSTSVAALGIACHEVGHAIQYHRNYAPIMVRNAFVPVANIGSMISWPLVLIGLVMGFGQLVTIGIVLFASVALFQLITLPVELNASRRAIQALDRGILDQAELNGTKRVLWAAAMTYVAALALSIAQLLRLLLLTRGRRD